MSYEAMHTGQKWWEHPSMCQCDRLYLPVGQRFSNSGMEPKNGAYPITGRPYPEAERWKIGSSSQDGVRLPSTGETRGKSCASA